MLAGDQQVQTAATQANSDCKPESSPLRRRQVSDHGGKRLVALVPSLAGSAASGQPNGIALSQQASASAAAAPAPVSATQVRPWLRDAAAKPSAQAPASRVPQPAQKTQHKPAAVQKKSTSAYLLPGPSAETHTELATEIPGGRLVQKTGFSAELAHVHRQGSSLTELVQKYKHDSAARKQAHNEVTLERNGSLAAGPQHAASANLTGRSKSTSPSVHKQAPNATSAGAVSSSRSSLMQAQAAATPKPQLAQSSQSARSLQAERDKALKSNSRVKALPKKSVAVSGSRLHMGSQSDTDSGNNKF